MGGSQRVISRMARCEIGSQMKSSEADSPRGLRCLAYAAGYES
ncbi:hypothetical protein RESH_05589 [Rhodopirellula europaea SH398]|uniref:Uncharacterized protein n=1 Tax=Rhodopirellula europaea SH398 TaxID=1263868 RepID=M5RWL9_9BACT|nr:hypothetical protein RESH_05589 [Rhodopirellula europaea SH398]